MAKVYASRTMQVADIIKEDKNYAIFSDSILMWSAPLPNEIATAGAVSQGEFPLLFF